MIEVPFFRDVNHYQAIAHCLTAGGFEARVYKGPEWHSVIVKLDDGRTLIWGNDGKTWGFTLVSASGTGISTGKAHLGAMAAPEAVAEFIVSLPVPL